jgi:Spy/CpxP family protein refolding chaperone
MAIIMALCANTFAQPEKHHEARRDEMQAKKVAFIATELELTTDEAQKFWPVFNEYQAELDKIRKEQMENFKPLMEARKSGTSLSESELDKLMNNRFVNHGKMLEVEKKYYDRFKKVLPMEKVARYYAAEERFKVEMLREMRDRPQGPGKK